MTNIKTEEEIAVENSSKRFVKIIILKTMYNIEKHYNKSISEYLKAVTLLHKRNLTTEENKEFAKFVTLFNLDCATVEKLIGRPTGIKRITKDVINFCVNNGYIEILNACNINYSSGKSFTHNRCYYLPVKLAEKYLNNKDVLNTNSSFYTKKEHKLIDKYIFKYDNKKAAEEVSKKEISQQDICHINPVQKEISQQNTQPATSSKPAISQPAPIVKKEIIKKEIVKKEIMKKNNDIIDEYDVIDVNSPIFKKNLKDELQQYVSNIEISTGTARTLYEYLCGKEHVTFKEPRNGSDQAAFSSKQKSKRRLEILENYKDKYYRNMKEDYQKKLDTFIWQTKLCCM